MKQTIEVSLADLGHILIPATLRNRLELFPGMTLVVERGYGDDLRLRVQAQPSPLVEKKGVLVVTSKPAGDLADIIQRERLSQSVPFSCQ